MLKTWKGATTKLKDIMKTIQIDQSTKVEVRDLKTESNYNKGVRIVVNNVVMAGWIAKDTTTTNEFKESAINWIERNKDNSLLKSLI